MADLLSIPASVVTLNTVGDRTTVGVQVNSSGLRSGYVTAEVDASDASSIALGDCTLAIQQGD